MTRISLLKNIAILFFSILLSGLLSIYLGKDVSWDLANYHYYNPYALFQQRWLIDYWPTSYPHVRLIPTLDIFLYYLINTFSSMYVMFITGAIHGLNFWFLFRIAYFFLSTEKNQYVSIVSLLLAALGIYGPTALTGMGSFQNDNLISLFVLGFVLLQLGHLNKSETNYRIIFLGGLLLGVGAALKFTAFIFVIAAFVLFACMPAVGSVRLKKLTLYSAGVGIGFVSFAGYWFWILYQQYNHSFAQLFNGLFYASASSSAFRFASEFLPHGIMQAIFFPFYFSWNGNIGASFQDFRFVILFLLLMMTGLAVFKNRKDHAILAAKLWLFGFVIVSYSIWEYCFGILRYIVAIEMLSPLLIYLLLDYLVQNKKKSFLIFSLLMSFVLITMKPIHLMRAELYKNSFFNVELPSSVKQTPAAMVLLAYPAYALSLEPKPQAYLIPFFPEKWRFVGVPFLKGRFFYEMQEHEKIKKVVDQYAGSIYLLTTDVMMPELVKTAKTFGLVPVGRCERIVSDRQRVSSKSVFLCGVERMNLPSLNPLL